MRPDGRVHPAKAVIVATAATLSAWMTHEGLVTKPMIPVQGDRPTIGYGATYYEDGTAVSMDDPEITIERAQALAQFHITDIYMRCVEKSLGDTPIHPKELQIATDFAGQYGCGAWNSPSSPLASYKQGNYTQACTKYLGYKFMTSDKNLGPGWTPYTLKSGVSRYRYDCSRAGNKVCMGVWTRSLGRYNDCMELQK